MMNEKNVQEITVTTVVLVHVYLFILQTNLEILILERRFIFYDEVSLLCWKIISAKNDGHFAGALQCLCIRAFLVLAKTCF